MSRITRACIRQTCDWWPDLRRKSQNGRNPSQYLLPKRIGAKSQGPGNFSGFLTWPETRSQPPRMRNARRMPKTGPEFHYYLPRPRPFLRIKREERRGRSKPRLQLVQFPPAASSHPTYPPLGTGFGNSVDKPAVGVARSSACALLRAPAPTRGGPALRPTSPAPPRPTSCPPGAENPGSRPHSAAMEVPGSLCKKVKLSNKAQNWVSAGRGGWEPPVAAGSGAAAFLPAPLHPLWSARDGYPKPRRLPAVVVVQGGVVRLGSGLCVRSDPPSMRRRLPS